MSQANPRIDDQATPIAGWYYDGGSGMYLPTALRATIDGALHAFETGQVGGGEGEDDPATAITRVVGNWNLTRVIGNVETVICNVPCRFGGFTFNTTSAGTVALRNAAAAGGGSTPLVLADATRDVQTPGDRFTTGLTAQGSAAGTDVTIRWRPIGTGGL